MANAVGASSSKSEKTSATSTKRRLLKNYIYFCLFLSLFFQMSENTIQLLMLSS